MFCKVVVSNPELCRHMLELILGTAIRKINISAAKHVMDIIADAKSIRLDVLLRLLNIARILRRINIHMQGGRLSCSECYSD